MYKITFGWTSGYIHTDKIDRAMEIALSYIIHAGESDYVQVTYQDKNVLMLDQHAAQYILSRKGV